MSIKISNFPPSEVVDKPCDVREPVSGTLGIVSVVFGLLIPFLLGKTMFDLKFEIQIFKKKCHSRFCRVLIRVMDSTAAY